MRTPVRTTAAAVAMGLTLTACGFSGGDEGSSGDDAGGGTTIDLLVPQYSDQTKALWQEIIAGFEEQNSGISVNLEVQSWDNINDVVRTKVQAGEAPDILNIDAFSGFAKDDLLYPAEEVVSPETLDDFQQSFIDNATLDGTVYGLPLIASARALFYNKDVLAQAGVSEPPSTWDQLLSTATKISELDADVYGYGMPLGSEEAQAETSIFTFGAGGAWTDGDSITVDTPENLEALKFMKSMIDAGVTQPDPGATDRTPMLDVFIQGKIAMAVGLPPTIGQIEERNPDLNYGIAPVPTKDGEPVTLGVADHLMAFRNDDDKKDAIRAFLDHFYSQDVYLSFVDAEGFLPTTKSGADGTENADRFSEFLEVLPNARFYPSTNEAWAATQGALQTLVGQIQSKDAAAVLKQIQDKADAA
ncbi:carbohydrate ABC transporter substrate-binding protein (CUT1 family) [Haloactinopolyspora alba]|uniref:Carbohydrate ABC transporter substrate-binding protein (CUT1 family) n=1 Tax=Haloactinopolyspora alba TaxID=648780 RepID=A0A2P8DM08_9ACTN|nr:extracellular solute-binding protein [Haloactinopolyspora alba]PSK98273.1 carbohydrate ABC transporter substrate-binding protein (CUT1 family) [Haloactinopolyspora alba]